jgi:hypothetical protein
MGRWKNSKKPLIPSIIHLYHIPTEFNNFRHSFLLNHNIIRCTTCKHVFVILKYAIIYLFICLFNDDINNSGYT